MLTDKDDIKIFILYLLNSVGYPLESSVLHDMSVQDGFITSFDFIEAYDELLKNDNIVLDHSQEPERMNVVSVTEKGRHIAETLHVRLLASVREKAMKSALRMLSFKKKGTRIKVEASEITRGRYELNCSIVDKQGELMELRVVYDNKKQLDRAEYNFDSRPEFIYKGILALLAGEVDYLLE